MALTITSGHVFSNGETMTTTSLNALGTPVLTVPADTLLGATATGSVTTVTCTAAGRALLDDTDASAQRTTLDLGTMATQNATSVAITGGTISAPWYAATPSTLTYAATATVDFSSTAATMQTVTLTGNLTLQTTNLAAGRVKAVRLVGDSSTRTLSLPSWKFMGSSAPTSLAANKTARINLESWGTADASVVAFYSVEL